MKYCTTWWTVNTSDWQSNIIRSGGVRRIQRGREVTVVVVKERTGSAGLKVARSGVAESGAGGGSQVVDGSPAGNTVWSSVQRGGTAT